MPTEVEILRAALKADPESHARLRQMAQEGLLGVAEDVPLDRPLAIVATSENLGIIGAKQVKCGCGAAVWIAPSTQAVILARGDAPTTVICAPCFSRVVKERREEKRQN